MHSIATLQHALEPFLSACGREWYGVPYQVVLSFGCNDEAGKTLLIPKRHLFLQSVLLCITSTCALVLRRRDIEAVAQGELHAA